MMIRNKTLDQNMKNATQKLGIFALLIFTSFEKVFYKLFHSIQTFLFEKQKHQTQAIIIKFNFVTINKQLNKN